MNNNWQKVKLGEVCEIFNGTTPSTKIHEYWNGEIPWITPKDLSSFNERYINQGERNISEKGLANSTRNLLPKNTILFSSRAPIGYVAIAGTPLSTNQGFKNFVCKENIDPLFLFYKLKLVGKDIENQSSGSTFAEASMNVVSNFEISLPPIEIQKSISKILSSLDDKIELLQKQNKTLENIAQTLFKRWFIEFNFPNKDGKPYKDNGGKMVESELGKIPEGWEIESIKRIINFIVDNRGKTPIFSSVPSSERYPLIEVNSIVSENRCMDLQKCRKFVDKDTYNQWFRTGHPIKGDILISTVGSLGAICQVREEKVCIAQNVIALRSTGKENFLYELIKSKKQEFIGLNISSVQPSIKVPHLLAQELILPDKDVINNFELISSRIVEKIHTNNIRIQTLSKLRDTLLPKLLNGEISI